MRITLYNPKTAYRSQAGINNFPLGLAAVAAASIDAGFPEITIVDANLLDGEGVIEVASSQPDIVGATSWLGAIPPLQELRKILPRNTPVVVGGPLATALPEYHLEEGADLVVFGEGTATFAEILSSRNPNLSRWKAVPGTAYCCQASSLTTPKEGMVRLTKVAVDQPHSGLLTAAYPLFDIDSYAKNWPSGKRGMLVADQCGCRHRCSFCAGNYLGGTWEIGPSALAQNIDYLKREGIESLYVAAATFTDRPEHVLSTCHILAEAELEWFCESRADRISADIAAVLAGSGCYKVMLGLESASDEITTRMSGGKGKEKLLRAIDLLRRHNLGVEVFVLFGLPGETETSIKDTIGFLECNQLIASPNVLFPIPTTPIWEMAKQKGVIPPLREYLERINEYFRQNRAFVPMPGICDAPDEALTQAVEWVWAHNARLKGK